MKLRLQIRLRTVFYLFVCAAIGLTARSTPNFARPAPRRHSGVRLQSFLGLTCRRQHRDKHWAHASGMANSRTWSTRASPEFRFAKQFAIFWRLTVAGLISLCIAGRVLLSRQLVTLPGREDYYASELFPDGLLIILVILTLIISIRKLRSTTGTTAHKVTDKLAFGFGAILFSFCHGQHSSCTSCISERRALNGRDRLRTERPEVFTDHRLERFQYFWLSLAAVFALWVAALCL